MRNEMVDQMFSDRVNNENKVQENYFQNLFSSVTKNNVMINKIYHQNLEQKVVKEQRTFDAMRGELNDAQNKATNKRVKFYQTNNEHIVAKKREANGDNPDSGYGARFVPITPTTAGPSTPFLHFTIKPRKDIFEAAVRNDIEALKRFIEVEGVPVNSTNALNQTVAHIVINRFDCIHTLEYLLNKDPSLISMKDKWGQTILHVAIRLGCRELMELLVDERNASIYEPIEARFGQSAIHLAAEECRLPIMEYFVEERKCDVNVRNALGEPPIFSAASYNHLNMVKYLMSKGADLHLVDTNDDNILFVSAKRGDLTIPRYLLDEKKIKFDLDWRNLQGETILHTAVRYRQFDFIKYLVEGTNIDKDMYDNLDRTAIYIATELGLLELVQYLVEHGANYKLNDIDGRIPAEIATNERVKEYLSSLK